MTSKARRVNELCYLLGKVHRLQSAAIVGYFICTVIFFAAHLSDIRVADDGVPLILQVPLCGMLIHLLLVVFCIFLRKFIDREFARMWTLPDGHAGHF